MSKIKPLFARVLLERPTTRKTAGGIIIPDDSAKRMARLKATVVAVGPTADDSIKIGQTVLIGRHAGDWMSKEGDPANSADNADFYVVQDEDIIAVVSGAST